MPTIPIDVHRNEDRVDPDERQPEMNPAQTLTHEAAKHLREPEVECRKHSEDRGHAHDEMEVSSYEIAVVHREIE